MAGWITMKVTLCESDEVERMKAALNLDTYQVVGRLQKIWSWAFLHTKKGGQSRLDCLTIDRKVECDGFAQAMIDVGWGVMMSPGFKFKNFGKNNKTDHELRADWAAKKRAQRIAREARMSPDCPQNVSGDKSEKITKPNLTKPNHKYISSSKGASTPKPGKPETAAAAEIHPSEEEKTRRLEAEAMVTKRPWWLPESRDWLGHHEAAEIVTLLWGLPEVNGKPQGPKVWKEIIVAAEKGKRLENPAGFVLATVRKRAKKLGGAK